MSATILEGDRLTTAVPARDMRVITFLHASTFAPRGQPWTAVFWGAPAALVWVHLWPGAITPGRLAAAHAAIARQVRRGALPAQSAGEEEAQHEQLAAAAK